MIENLCLPASALSFIPPALAELVRLQLLEDLGDDDAPGIAEVESRLNAARQSPMRPLFFLVLETADDGSAGGPGADRPGPIGQQCRPGEHRPEDRELTEYINSADLLAFAMANVNFGLETGGHYLWINELHVAGHARRRGIGKGLLTHIENWGRENSIVYQACLTGRDNEAAQAMYRNTGHSISRVLWVEKEL